VSEVDLKRLRLLAERDAPEREAIAEELEPLALDAGTLLFEEGEQSEGLIWVVEGAVRVEGGRAAAAEELGPGAALGALSLVASGPRAVRAETTSRSRLLVFRRSAFRRFADAEPRAACRLLEAILRDTARAGREALADVDRLRGDD
jgi:CRP-like cAMP-binding protein